MDENIGEAMMDYIQSCHMTWNPDHEHNIRHFMRENSHMNLDESEVRELYYQFDDY